LFAAVGNDAGAKLCVVLDGRGQWSNQIHAWGSQNFTYLVESDFNFAPGDSFKAFRTLLKDDGLWFHRLRDAQALKRPEHINTDRRSCCRIVPPDRL
jgi:hypothetical protein